MNHLEISDPRSEIAIPQNAERLTNAKTVLDETTELKKPYPATLLAAGPFGGGDADGVSAAAAGG